jgi:hypothetical protein
MSPKGKKVFKGKIKIKKILSYNYNCFFYKRKIKKQKLSGFLTGYTFLILIS